MCLENIWRTNKYNSIIGRDKYCLLGEPSTMSQSTMTKIVSNLEDDKSLLIKLSLKVVTFGKASMSSPCKRGVVEQTYGRNEIALSVEKTKHV